MSEKLLLSDKAITLISLIITIIILLILGGVGINLSLRENGIFRRAKEAQEKYMAEEEKEQQELNELYSEMGKIDLPENTKETQAGTEVQIPNKWITKTPTHITTPDGDIVKESKISSTVYAVSGGKGHTVPIPNGFYYVGGDIETGVVISDNKSDENKYKGQTEEITDTEGNKKVRAYVGKEDLAGNQFVWIECDFDSTNDIVDYEKTSFYNISDYPRSIPGSEISYVERYNGFYIGRYEAGLPTTITEIKENTSYNSTVYNKVGIPQSKAGLVPWNFIDWTTAKLSCEKMYKDSNSVSSVLITGAGWDTTINTIVNKQENITLEDVKGTGSLKFGNYYTTQISYTGRKATIFNNGSWCITPFSEINKDSKTNLNSYELLSTGASQETKTYNIYDMAGNLIEWTDEVSSDGVVNYRQVRGGGVTTGVSNCIVGSRTGFNITTTDYALSFRVALYII